MLLFKMKSFYTNNNIDIFDNKMTILDFLKKLHKTSYDKFLDEVREKYDYDEKDIPLRLGLFSNTEVYNPNGNSYRIFVLRVKSYNNIFYKEIFNIPFNNSTNENPVYNITKITERADLLGILAVKKGFELDLEGLLKK